MEVFLSYAAADGPDAKRLAEALKARGVDVWFDQWELVPGQSWGHELVQALEQASAMVVLLTPQSVESDWVKSEINFALTRETFQGRVFPVVMGDGEPAHIPWILRRFPIQYVSPNRSGSVERSADMIARSLEASARVGTH